MSSPCNACIPEASIPSAPTPLPVRRAAVASLSLGEFSLVIAEFRRAGLLTAMATGLGASDGAADQTATATALVAASRQPVRT